MKIASTFASVFAGLSAAIILNSPLASAQAAGQEPATVPQTGQAGPAADDDKVVVTSESRTLHLFERLKADCLYGVDPVSQFRKNEGCAVMFFGNERNMRDMPVWVLGFKPGQFAMPDIPVVFVCALDQFDLHVVTLAEAAYGNTIQKICRQAGQAPSDRYVYQEAVGLTVLRASDYDHKAVAEFQDFLRYRKYLAAWQNKQDRKFASRQSYAVFCEMADRQESCPANYYGRTRTPMDRQDWQ